MDPKRFEELTRRVSRATDRRAAVKAFVVALAAPVLVGLGRQEAEAGIPIVNCGPGGKSGEEDTLKQSIDSLGRLQDLAGKPVTSGRISCRMASISSTWLRAPIPVRAESLPARLIPASPNW